MPFSKLFWLNNRGQSTYPWSSFHEYSTQYSFQATGCFPTKPLLKHWTVVRGTNVVTVTTIRLGKEYWSSQGSNQ